MEFVSYDKPRTWVPYRKGLCDGCRADCCRLPVEAIAEDMVRMGFAHEDEIRGSLKKLSRRLKAEGIISQFRARTGLFTLEQRPNGDCIFLDPVKRTCRIYDRRPQVCREFPSIGPKPGFCPNRAKDQRDIYK